MDPAGAVVLTWIDILSISSSLFSIALALVALWLSWKFFTSTNSFEKEAAKLLTGIHM